MYTQFENISVKLKKREKMRVEVEKYWDKKGHNFSHLIRPKPVCFLARHIAVHNNEAKEFVKLANSLELCAYFSEYLEDQYITASTPKTLCLKPILADEGKFKLCNPAQWQKKKLSEILTKNGKKMVDFHHQEWEKISGNKYRADWSEWLQKFGSAKDYYFAELSIYVAHGVLFKDFHNHGKMSSQKAGEFTREIVEPAFQKIIEVFGTKPLIYQFKYQDGFEIFPTIRR